MSYSFKLDTSQQRPKKDFTSVLISGLAHRDTKEEGWEWRNSLSSNVWVDPVNFTLMLIPAPLTPEWQTTSTGIYARLVAGDFSFATAASWTDSIKNGGASSFVTCLDATLSEVGITTTSWAKNRAFYLGFYASNWGNDRFRQLSCGWNDTGDENVGVVFDFYSDGDYECYKDGVFVASGKYTGGRSKSQTSNTFVSLILLPYRQREILVYSNYGHGESVIFDDILEDDPDPTITSAGKFWVKFHAGKAEFECAPVRYPSSGYGVSIETHFRTAPSAGATPSYTTFRGFPGYGTQGYDTNLVETDGSTVFTPNGTKTACRIKVDLTGDEESTAFIYGSFVEYPGEQAFTDDSEEVELLDYIIKASLEVPEHAANVSLSLQVRDPDLWDPYLVYKTSNRPLNLILGPYTIIEGRTDPITAPVVPTGVMQPYTLHVRTAYKALENYIFPDDVPLDGLSFEDAFKIPLYRIGMDDTRISILNTSYTIPDGGPNSEGGFNLIIKAGERASEVLDRLRSSYAPLHNFDFVPTYDGVIARLADATALGDTPLLTLYTSADDAYAYWISEGYTDQEAGELIPRRAIQVLDEKIIEPEANDVYVIGMDRRKLRPLIARKSSETDSDPTTPPSLRGDNWLGEIRRYSWVDNTLTTIDVCETACDLLYQRLAHRRELIEVKVDWILDVGGLPLWRGDVVTIDGLGDYRIISFNTTYELFDSADRYRHWAETRYVMEKIGIEASGTGHNSQGSTLRVIAEYYLQRLNESIGGPGAKIFPISASPVDVSQI